MFEDLLSKIAINLKANAIPYMIIGGQAVLLYGEPRLTRDIDITLGVNTDRLRDLLGIIQDMSFRPLTEDIESFVRQTMVLPVMDDTTGIRVDFIFSFTHYETEAIKRARRIRIKDMEVCFASPEDVIIHKIFAGRPRDIEDCKAIILKNPDLDIRYIRNWLREFDSVSDEKIFLRTFEELMKSLK
jgi:predicted nucleotidyltransferase